MVDYSATFLPCPHRILCEAEEEQKRELSEHVTSILATDCFYKLIEQYEVPCGEDFQIRHHRWNKGEVNR